MKKLGVGLILAGMIVVFLYVAYTIITLPEIHLMLRLGFIGLLTGFLILILGLVIERKKDREADDDDTGKY